MRNTFVKIVLLIFTLSSLVAIPLYSLNQQGYFLLTEIKFELPELGDNKLYMSSLLNDLEKNLNSIKGRSLFEVDLNEVAKVLNTEKWIKNFEIQREWPSSLRVKINTHDLVMLYMNEKNEIYPIFSNNEILNKVSGKEIPDAIHVYDKKLINEKEARRKTIDVIQRLPDKGPLNPKEIAEIGYDSKAGFWLQLIKKDLLVKLGEENIEVKTERVSNVIDYLESKQIDARVIDANLSQKVLVRSRKDP